MKRFYAALMVAAATMAVVFTVSPAWAATPPRGNPALVLRLDADGSLTLSQRDSGAGAVIELPSIQALPVEIDTLVPQTRERIKLVLSADSKSPYRNFLKVMKAAREAGFSELGILESEKEARGEISELVVNLRGPNKWPPGDRVAFVSLEDDRSVIVSLGLPGISKSAQKEVVDMAGVPDLIIDLVPTGRPQKELYFRADFAVPVGDAIGLLRKLHAIGFGNKNTTILGEETE